jgi:hypothetical protein
VPKRAVPGARVRVPVDPPTALRLRSAGIEVEGPPSYTAVFRMPADDPLALVAADRCEPSFDDAPNELVLDLAEKAWRLVDHTPPVPPDAGIHPAPLWEPPSLEPYRPTPLHLPADAKDTGEALTRWVECLPIGHQAALDEAQAAWRAQAERMTSVAKGLVKIHGPALPTDDRQRLHSMLNELVQLVRHGNDDPEQAIGVDEKGEIFERETFAIINRAYMTVWARCETIGKTGDQKGRGAAINAELDRMALFLADDFPERMALAHEAGLLHKSVGVARTELLPVAWPAWRYLHDDEALSAIVNPSAEALRALLAARDEAVRKPWFTEDIDLKWLMPDEQPVLMTAFLGATIIKNAKAS